MASAIILLWGCVSMMRSEVDIFPDLNAPTVVVMTEAPGLAPEEVEKLVSFPIETAVNGATDVKRVRSSSATGFSVVWVEFDWGVDIYKARQIVSEKLSSIAEKLPDGVKSPVLGPQSSILGEMLIISLTSDSTSLMQLRSIADKVIAPRLLSLGGVSQVNIQGGDVAEYQILLSPDRMKYYGVTLDQVIEASQGLNTNSTGGIIYDYGNEYIIKADIHTTFTEDIEKAVVAKTESGQIVTIADIANVVIGPQTPILGLASHEAKPAVLLTVTKQPSAGTINLTERIEDALATLSPTLPSDIQISTDIFRQSDFIGNSISNLQMSLMEGALFVIIVIFFFLMDLRTTIISVVALPISIIITVLLLNLLGLTINTMSLGGIAIAIGSLVDDAIVDVENVYKRLKLNKQLPPEQREPITTVVFHASREVRLPILNSTLIIIASFLPLFFLTGMEGRLLIPLGISFVISLAVSTLVALTITPILCSYLLAGHSTKADINSQSKVVTWLQSCYSRALAVTMNHKRKLLYFTAIIFIVTLCLLPTLGRSFLPSFNEGSMTINVSTFPGVSLEESDKIGREAEKIILSIPEVKTVARKTGRAELDEHSLGANVSEIEAPYQLSGRSKSAMVAELRDKLTKIPGTNIEIGQPISHRIDAMLSGTESQIAIKLFGEDLEVLHAKAIEIKKAITGIDGIVDVNVEQQVNRPQIDIRPRREMLSRYGITNAQFTAFVNTMLSGQPISQVYVDGFPMDITLKVEDGSRNHIGSIDELMIDTPEGKIPLGLVADVISTSGPNTINRENVNRRIVISTNVENRDLKGAVDEIKSRIAAEVALPQGYYLQYGGQFENEASATRTLVLASLGALLIIFMLLYHEYKNLANSFIILINMPLALIGGVLILLFTKSELNIPAIIGFISLMGIATRNGMLLMSRYETLHLTNASIKDVILKGSLDRLSPIIMTALTSALALIPLALKYSEPGNEIQSPMALVILGGLFTSTSLNLFVVPALYYIFNRKRYEAE